MRLGQIDDSRGDIMAIRQPESMDELVYFTRRDIGDNGKVMVWVFRQLCPECKKGIMGKPMDKKTGKIKTRSTAYACPECGYEAEKKEYEDSLAACVSYTCPHCGNTDEVEVPFRRKNIGGVPTLRVKCGKCGGNIDVKKKMKGED